MRKREIKRDRGWKREAGYDSVVWLSPGFLFFKLRWVILFFFGARHCHCYVFYACHCHFVLCASLSAAGFSAAPGPGVCCEGDSESQEANLIKSTKYRLRKNDCDKKGGALPGAAGCGVGIYGD